MSRQDRMCKRLPSWALRLIVSLPSWRGWWTSAWLELFQREVVDVIHETADDESGPWPVAMPRGMH